MNFEEYVRDELKKIDSKIDDNNKKIEKLMIFMAVEKATQAKTNKHTAAIVAIICSVASSGIILFLEKMMGG